MKKILTVLILLTTLVGLANAQKTIEGVVKDFDGVPLPGVNVTIKGTTTGTITDLDGKYTMQNVPEGSTLTYSFMGMLTEEILIQNQTNVDVMLVEDLMSLEEVVVVGYGETKRANLTGSVTDMTTEQIDDIPSSNLGSLLEGRLSGVKIEQSTGLPGSSVSIQIRGNSSFGATESPLYVIDGVIDDDNTQFSMLDPSEIESISVLKDASAAVYGARGAGGVILVTTRKGKEGKPQINYSGSYGISNATQLPEMLSAYDQAQMLNYIYDNDSENDAGLFDSYSDDELEAFKNLDYSWLDALWQSASTTRHTLNVSGGSENVHYFIGGSYFNEQGNIQGYNTNRYSVRSNIDAKITENLTAKFNISASAKDREYPYYVNETQSGVARSFFTKLITTPKWVPSEVDNMPVGNQFSEWQPFGLLQSGSYKNSRSFNTNFQGELEYQVPFVKGLSVGVTYNYSISNGKGKSYLQDYYRYIFDTQGENGHIISTDPDDLMEVKEVDNGESIYLDNDLSTGYQLNAYLAYSKKFGLHNVSAKFVYEQVEDESSSNSVYRKGATTKGVDQLWAYNSDSQITEANEDESGRLSYVGRLNYNYSDKYLIEGTFRYEASSKFKPSEAWGFFPAGSVGWIVSEEDFFRNNIHFINFMKLRASVGLLGNDATASNQWSVSYSGNQTGPIFDGSITNAIDTQKDGLSTPTLTWQKTRFYNLGADWRFLNNKVDMGIDYYYKYTFDILAERSSSLPVSAGINDRPDENYGEMYATGIEIEATYHGKIGNEFKYDVGGQFSWDKRMKVVVDQSEAAIGRWDDQTKNAPDNQPGYICLGMIRTEEDLAMVKEMYDSIGTEPVEIGMLYYADIRGENYSEGADGKIDKNDMTTIAKHTSAPYHYSINLGASWKGIDASLLFTGMFGHKAFVEKDEMTLPDDATNVFTWWNDYWTPENTDASMPRPYRYGEEAQKSTFWMRDGNTLRLKSLNIGYTPPSNFLTQHNLPKFRVYFSAHNLWTIISPFDYKDPSVSRAYDYPMTRSYNFGVNLTL